MRASGPRRASSRRPSPARAGVRARPRLVPPGSRRCRRQSVPYPAPLSRGDRSAYLSVAWADVVMLDSRSRWVCPTVPRAPTAAIREGCSPCRRDYGGLRDLVPARVLVVPLSSSLTPSVSRSRPVCSSVHPTGRSAARRISSSPIASSPTGPVMMAAVGQRVEQPIEVAALDDVFRYPRYYS